MTQIDDDDNGEIYSIRLGGSKFVVVSRYEGVAYIHIREYLKKLSGSIYPTKKGVALNESRLSAFLSFKDEVSQKIAKWSEDEDEEEEEEEWQKDLGGGNKITIKPQYKCIDFRRYFIPNDEDKEKPTRSGISVKFTEWERLLKIIKKVQNMVDEFKEPKHCTEGLDHQNQLGALRCRECTPYPTKELLDYC